MKIAVNGVRRTHTANKCHTHVKHTSVCITLQAKMNFAYTDSLAPVAEDLNFHKLVFERGDDFEANAVVGLGCRVGFGSCRLLMPNLCHPLCFRRAIFRQTQDRIFPTLSGIALLPQASHPLRAWSRFSLCLQNP